MITRLPSVLLLIVIHAFSTFVVASPQPKTPGCPPQLDLKTYLTLKFEGALMTAGAVEGTSASFSSIQDPNLARTRTLLEEALLNHFNDEKYFKLLQEKDGVCDYTDGTPNSKTHVSYLLKK